jgi:hypothetical protein
MELSNGFVGLYKGVRKNVSIAHTLIPPPNVVAQLIVNNPLDLKPRTAGSGAGRRSGEERRTSVG